MALPRNNTKTYSGSKKGAARFARKTIEALKPDCASIMIIGQDISEDYFASIAIEGSLADIGHLLEKSSSKQQQNTLPDLTPGG